jgi:hypothetical protein
MREGWLSAAGPRNDATGLPARPCLPGDGGRPATGISIIPVLVQPATMSADLHLSYNIAGLPGTTPIPARKVLDIELTVGGVVEFSTQMLS